MNQSHYDQEKQLLITQFTGDVDLNEYLSYIYSLNENPEYSRNINILIDFRNANSLYSISGIKKISDATKQAFQHYSSAKIAIIENNPLETALSILYQKITKQKNYRFRIFSTKDATLKWLTGE